MYKILTMNTISPIYKEILPAEEYEVSPTVENPDAILVRSADLHEFALPQNVKCVARAGAGVNNIPLDAFGEKGVVVFNTPGANANAVKELVLAGMLLASRDIVGGIARASRSRAKRASPSRWKKARTNLSALKSWANAGCDRPVKSGAGSHPRQFSGHEGAWL